MTKCAKATLHPYSWDFFEYESYTMKGRSVSASSLTISTSSPSPFVRPWYALSIRVRTLCFLRISMICFFCSDVGFTPV